MLTQKRLKELIKYDPLTGSFIRINKIHSNVKGIGCGCIVSNGYRSIPIDGNCYGASRIAFLYMEGYFPENDMDHINRIRNDDRWCNLRHTTRQCNMRNRKVFSSNTSEITGVSWHKNTNKWQSKIKVNRVSIYLGLYESKSDAAKARWEAEKKYNFPNCNSTSSAYRYLIANKLI